MLSFRIRLDPKLHSHYGMAGVLLDLILRFCMAYSMKFYGFSDLTSFSLIEISPKRTNEYHPRNASDPAGTTRHHETNHKIATGWEIAGLQDVWHKRRISCSFLTFKRASWSTEQHHDIGVSVSTVFPCSLVSKIVECDNDSRISNSRHCVPPFEQTVRVRTGQGEMSSLLS